MKRGYLLSPEIHIILHRAEHHAANNWLKRDINEGNYAGYPVCLILSIISDKSLNKWAYDGEYAIWPTRQFKSSNFDQLSKKTTQLNVRLGSDKARYPSGAEEGPRVH